MLHIHVIPCLYPIPFLKLRIILLEPCVKYGLWWTKIKFSKCIIVDLVWHIPSSIGLQMDGQPFYLAYSPFTWAYKNSGLTNDCGCDDCLLYSQGLLRWHSILPLVIFTEIIIMALDIVAYYFVCCMHKCINYDNTVFVCFLIHWIHSSETNDLCLLNWR